MSAEDVARGIVQIADHNMVNALKLISINKGFDPRDFTLIAFGGGGGMHAVSLAQELGVKSVVIPKAAGVFSAWGMMMSDLRRDYFVTKLVPLSSRDGMQETQQLLSEIKHKARSEYVQEGVPESGIHVVQSLSLRYEHQEHAVEVILEDQEEVSASIDAIERRFHSEYKRLYTYTLDAPVELVGVHITAFAAIGKPVLQQRELTDRPSTSAVKGKRQVDYGFSGKHEATIYNSELLEPGMTFSGPAIIEDPGTTIVVYPHNTVAIDQYGNTCITNLSNGEHHA